MEVKRFFGTDTKEVLKQIRETIGDDAMILSNRKVDDGVEILCSLEEEIKAECEFNPSVFQQDTTFHNAFAETSEVTTTTTAPVDTYALTQVKNEIQSLRNLIEDQLSDFAWKDILVKRPVYAVVIKRLMQSGFSGPLAKKLAMQVDETADVEKAWSDITQKITRFIPCSNGDLLNTSRIIALVGPSCAGKTSSLIKLAARYMLAHSTKDVVIITTDVYRVGSYESLKMYSNILGATLLVVEPTQTLNAVLQKVKSAKLILIDTPSAPKKRLQVLEEMKDAAANGFAITKLLVVSALQQYKALSSFYQQVKRYDLSGTILTHLDEISSLGEAFGFAIENQLALSYVTSGEQVPEDIRTPDMTTLVKKCFELGARKENEMIKESFAIKLLSEVV